MMKRVLLFLLCCLWPALADASLRAVDFNPKFRDSVRVGAPNVWFWIKTPDSTVLIQGTLYIGVDDSMELGQGYIVGVDSVAGTRRLCTVFGWAQDLSVKFQFDSTTNRWSVFDTAGVRYHIPKVIWADTGSANTEFKDSIVIVPGTNITLVRSGNTLTIGASSSSLYSDTTTVLANVRGGQNVGKWYSSTLDTLLILANGKDTVWIEYGTGGTRIKVTNGTLSVQADSVGHFDDSTAPIVVWSQTFEPNDSGTAILGSDSLPWAALYAHRLYFHDTTGTDRWVPVLPYNPTQGQVLEYDTVGTDGWKPKDDNTGAAGSGTGLRISGGAYSDSAMLVGLYGILVTYNSEVGTPDTFNLAVDTAALPFDLYLPLAGGTMSSNAQINMSGGTITGVDTISGDNGTNIVHINGTEGAGSGKVIIGSHGTTQGDTVVMAHNVAGVETRTFTVSTPLDSISAEGHKITMVADPTAAQDAATKNFTENAIDDSLAAYLPLVAVDDSIAPYLYWNTGVWRYDATDGDADPGDFEFRTGDDGTGNNPYTADTLYIDSLDMFGHRADTVISALNKGWLLRAMSYRNRAKHVTYRAEAASVDASGYWKLRVHAVDTGATALAATDTMTFELVADPRFLIDDSLAAYLLTSLFDDSLAAQVDPHIGDYIDTTTLDTIQNAHKAVFADSAENISDGAVDATDKIGTGAVSSDDVADQGLTKSDLDSTASNFVFDDAYRGTSQEAESAYATILYARDAAGDTAVALRDGDTWTGTHDYGGATVLEIPNSDNPTLTAEGTLAYDANNDALVGTDGTLDFQLAAKVKYFSMTIDDPDGLANDTVMVLAIETGWAPFGIVLTEIGIKTRVSTTYDVGWAEYSAPATRQNATDTISTAATLEASETTITDATLDAGDILMIEIPDTDNLDQLQIWGTFYIATGN